MFSAQPRASRESKLQGCTLPGPHSLPHPPIAKRQSKTHRYALRTHSTVSSRLLPVRSSSEIIVFLLPSSPSLLNILPFFSFRVAPLVLGAGKGAAGHVRRVALRTSASPREIRKRIEQDMSCICQDARTASGGAIQEPEQHLTYIAEGSDGRAQCATLDLRNLGAWWAQMEAVMVIEKGGGR